MECWNCKGVIHQDCVLFHSSQKLPRSYGRKEEQQHLRQKELARISSKAIPTKEEASTDIARKESEKENQNKGGKGLISLQPMQADESCQQEQVAEWCGEGYWDQKGWNGPTTPVSSVRSLRSIRRLVDEPIVTQNRFVALEEIIPSDEAGDEEV